MTQVNMLVQSLALVVALILCTLWLKRRGTLAADNRAIFSRLVTDLALPALILETFARHSFEFRNLLPAVIMLAATIICLVAGGVIGRFVFRLERAKLGAVILVSGFGSSASLGYAIIQHMMGNNPKAVNDALIIGEFGATMPFFVIGVAIAIYFGSTTASAKGQWGPSLAFFRSPIFVSMVVGISLSFLHLSESQPVIAFLYQVLHVIGGSLMLMVAITIGLMLRPIPVKALLPLILVVVPIKLLLQPLLAYVGAQCFGMPNLERTVLVVESAMPSGLIATVVGARYGLDGGLASAITIATYIASVVTMPGVLLLIS